MILNNNKGITLVELVAAMALIGILSLGFFIGMTNFVTTYQETRDFLQLQRELYDVMSYVRHGYVKRNVNDETALIGLLTAQKVQVHQSGREMTLVPVDGDYGARHWVRYSLDYHGRMILNAQYGYRHISNEVLFPKKDQFIGRQLKYQITDLRFQDLTSETAGTAYLVRVYVQGMVRFRERGKNQSEADDMRLNRRYIEYETTVFVGNADKNQDF